MKLRSMASLLKKSAGTTVSIKQTGQRCGNFVMRLKRQDQDCNTLWARLMNSPTASLDWRCTNLDQARLWQTHCRLLALKVELPASRCCGTQHLNSRTISGPI